MPLLKNTNLKDYDIYIRQNGSEIKIPEKVSTILQLKEFAYKQGGAKTYILHLNKKGTTIEEMKKALVVTERNNPLKFKVAGEVKEKNEAEIIFKKEEKEMPDLKEYYELREKINNQNHKIEYLEKEISEIKSEINSRIANLKAEFDNALGELQDQFDEVPDIEPVEDPWHLTNRFLI